MATQQIPGLYGKSFIEARAAREPREDQELGETGRKQEINAARLI